MHQTTISILVGCVCIIAAATILYSKTSFENAAAPRARDVVSEPLLRVYANEHGSTSTVAFVRREARRFSAADQHLSAHALGQILFEREGATAAFQLCGALFGYGCLHQIVSQVSPEQGIETALDAERVCREIAPRARGDCLHAAGHSIIFSRGYTEEAARESFAECEKTMDATAFDTEQSCYGGAFMEYNMRFMQDGAFNGGHARASTVPFCLSLNTETARRTCIFWMAPKVHAALGFRYTDTVFRTLGRFCNDSVPEQYRDACMESVGRSIGLIGYISNEQAAHYCEVATQGTPYNEGCVEWAARTITASNANSDITGLCDTLKEHAPACMSFSKTFIR
ncbi:MAG: hypothetical protein KBE09_00230 [Candidatus Pacebacteria bacterium]|nr:hypothetical protein [Candidatus Paceibacterota bacterium]